MTMRHITRLSSQHRSVTDDETQSSPANSDFLLASEMQSTPSHHHHHPHRTMSLCGPSKPLTINPSNLIPIDYHQQHSILSSSLNLTRNYDPQKLTSNPINSTILSIATHPDFSGPLSAVLQAGRQAPGRRYSCSPTVNNLSNILLISRSIPSNHSRSNNSSLSSTPAITNHSKTESSCSHVSTTSSSSNDIDKAHNASTKWWKKLTTVFEAQDRKPSPSRLNTSSLINHDAQEGSDNSSATNFEATLVNESSEQSTGSSFISISSLANDHNPIKTIDLQHSTQSSVQKAPNHEQDEELKLIDWDEVDRLIQSYDVDPNSFRKPKYPLILCHGLLGFDTLGPPYLGLNYFRGVKEALQKMGVEVHVAKVPPCAGIEERARKLAEFIELTVPGKTVNLIGHSMGGLDSRFLITHLRPKSFKVASLTTIGTPHRGSAFADYLFLDVLGPKRMEQLLHLMDMSGIGGQAFSELTMRSMNKFNEVTPNLDRNKPTVSYFSYGAKFDLSSNPSNLIGRLFKVPWTVIFEREGPNDGLVSISSAKWGDYLGTLDNVNHAQLVGWTIPTNKKNSSQSLDSNHQSRFEAVSFFLYLTDSLAKKGF